MKLFVGMVFCFLVFTTDVFALNNNKQKQDEGPKSFTVEIKNDEPNPAQLFEKQLLSKRKSRPRRTKKIGNSSKGNESASMPTVGSGMFIK
ncbi:MAG: hypothetical protein E7016_03580 [Alphaproteobacteria bacterium]|nr:hypothetical protein [Alphaproteobacteria bacterium]